MQARSTTVRAEPWTSEVERMRTARLQELELQREQDLMRLIPKGRRSVLDIGARDGHYSRLLRQHFQEVTAIDLAKPTFSIPGVRTMQGDVRRLHFPDASVDCVFCTEVLEHVPGVEQAAEEIARVAKHEVVIGVPYRQDIRLGRTQCRRCGARNPPWGHVNSFDEARLSRLFRSLRLSQTSYVGATSQRTNWLSAALMDMAGNPWGTYEQEEPCVQCGATLEAPEHSPLFQKVCAKAGFWLTGIQIRLARSRPNWIHVVFTKAL
jgi:SAM-dependent methyltransferase